MPRCHLTRELLKELEAQLSDRTVHYSDKDLPGFLLEKRPNSVGTWYFRYRNADRKNRYCRLGAADALDILEARAMAYKLYRAILDGREPPVRRLSGDVQTMNEFVVQHYLPHARLNKRSWKTDEGMLRTRILPSFGEGSLSSVCRLDVVNGVNEMRRRGLCPGTCNRTLALLRFIFNCAIRGEVLPAGSNPCTGVHPLEDNGARERYLSGVEARALVRELDEMGTPSACAIKLLLFTGARKSEILSARWEHVDFERQILTVPLSKSGKTRHIPLSEQAMGILRGIPQNGSPWLFVNPRTGKPFRTIFRSWDTLRRRLNMPDVRLHDLRHSFASFLVNSGCSLYEVQKILGHYDPKVTMRYAHLATETLIRAANMAACVVTEGNGAEKGGVAGQHQTHKMPKTNLCCEKVKKRSTKAPESVRFTI